MAQVVSKDKEKLQYRFRLFSKGCDKKLRSYLFQNKHTHTHREDLDFDAAIFYAPYERSIVTPFLYGAKAVEGVLLNLELDRQWINDFNSLAPKFPKIGIGRGAHFLNVLSGGSLWQKTEGHNEASQGHDLKILETGEIIRVPSSHTASMQVGHGAMVFASANSSKKLQDHECVLLTPNDWEDSEIVYYPHTNSLCFEPHPETLGYRQYSDMAMYCIEQHIMASHEPF